jgi:hypothetical protein
MGVKLKVYQGTLQKCWSHPPAQLQSPGMKGQNFILGPFWPRPQSLWGWTRGWDPHFRKLLSQTNSFTPMLTWCDDIKFLTPSSSQLGPERVSISVKMRNSLRTRTLHFLNQHHQIILKHLFSVDPYDSQTKEHNLADQ